jgi:hypothetical protein
VKIQSYVKISASSIVSLLILLSLTSRSIAADSAASLGKVVECSMEKIELGRWGFIEVPFEGGVPFIAEAHYHNEHKVGNELRSDPVRVEKLYRDAKGRVRKESLPDERMVGGVTLLDPVAGIRYSLDLLGETGIRQELSPLPSKAVVSTPISKMGPLPLGVQIICRALGTKVFEGIDAEGESVHVTNTDPKTGQVLSELTTERWYSTTLKVQLFGSIRNSQTGNFSKSLTHIRTLEAAPELFKPRPGGKIWGM